MPAGADAPLPALWRSREVRWFAGSGLLIAAGYLAGPLGAQTGVHGVVHRGGGGRARFFAAEAIRLADLASRGA